MAHVMDIVRALDESDMNTQRPFYFIGMGGAGMSVIAQMLCEQGKTVAGSDRSDGPALQRLADMGITCHVGHQAANVPDDAIVVASSAISLDNPELAIAIKRKQRIIHRSQALVLAAAHARFVAVAGAHGKTTTSAMIAQALRAAGKDPSFAVGGVVKGYGTGAHVGRDPICVAEADESDSSFLNYDPFIGVITNIEPDHLDFYGSEQAFHDAFYRFARKVSPEGAIVLCSDDPGARALAQRLCRTDNTPPIVTYGVESGIEAPDSAPYTHATVECGDYNGQALEAVFNYRDTRYRASIPVPGLHNALNACAAWCVGIHLGIDPQQMCEALSSFEGTGRRFEFKGEVNGIRVIDDYAHHPTEVDALIRQARQAHPHGRIHILFQPHLYSRTKNFADRFAQALRKADTVVLAEIYGAREDPMPGVSSQLITDLVPSSRYIPDRFEAARYIAGQAQPGDMIATVGAGNITEAAGTVLATLEERFG